MCSSHNRDDFYDTMFMFYFDVCFLLQQKQSQFFMNILNSLIHRQKPSYFRVVYYGKSFPPFIRVRSLSFMIYILKFSISNKNCKNMWNVLNNKILITLNFKLLTSVIFMTFLFSISAFTTLKTKLINCSIFFSSLESLDYSGLKTLVVLDFI